MNKTANFVYVPDSIERLHKCNAFTVKCPDIVNMPVLSRGCFFVFLIPFFFFFTEPVMKGDVVVR